MRTREIIKRQVEQDLRRADTFEQQIGILQGGILEVLLDIRDLLTPTAGEGKDE